MTGRVPRLRHLRPADYRVMPWKNGLGTTTEIAVHPEGAALDAFTWRLSIADLRASGPFSTFAGYDRTIIQIEGAPMTLTHQGLGEHRLRLLEPHRFPGELATSGALDPPPARDFNVIVRRDRAHAEVRVLELASGEAARAGGDCDTLVVYVLRGRASVAIASEVRALAANETLLAAETEAAVITAAEAGTAAFVVTIAQTKAAGARIAQPPEAPERR